LEAFFLEAFFLATFLPVFLAVFLAAMVFASCDPWANSTSFVEHTRGMLHDVYCHLVRCVKEKNAMGRPLWASSRHYRPAIISHCTDVHSLRPAVVAHLRNPREKQREHN
jgi:hypothetical protein